MKSSILTFTLLLSSLVHGAEIVLTDDYSHFEEAVTLTHENAGVTEGVVELVRTAETPIKVLLVTSVVINRRVCEYEKTIVVGKKCKTDKYGNEICKDLYDTICAEYGIQAYTSSHTLKLNFKKLGPLKAGQKQTYTLKVSADHSGPDAYIFNYSILTPVEVKGTKTFGSLFSFKKR